MTDSTAPSDFTTKRILHTLPDGISVNVQRYSLPRRRSDDLFFDVYSAAAQPSTAAPLVLLVTGYPDPGFHRLFGCVQKDMGSYVSWAELLAASGMTAVTYQNEDPVQDAVVVWDHLKQNAETFGIDPQRMGVWSCSGNGPNALALLSVRGECRAAALLYCYTLDESGHSAVAEAATGFRFTNPMAGRSVADLCRSAQLLLVRAEDDVMPGLNESMDRFLSASRARALPVECLEVPGAPHAFDTDHDHPATAAAIESVLSFFRERLIESEI